MLQFSSLLLDIGPYFMEYIFDLYGDMAVLHWKHSYSVAMQTENTVEFHVEAFGKGCYKLDLYALCSVICVHCARRTETMRKVINSKHIRYYAHKWNHIENKFNRSHSVKRAWQKQRLAIIVFSKRFAIFLCHFVEIKNSLSQLWIETSSRVRYVELLHRFSASVIVSFVWKSLPWQNEWTRTTLSTLINLWIFYLISTKADIDMSTTKNMYSSSRLHAIVVDLHWNFDISHKVRCDCV